jgi:hypothetical protein
MKTLLSLRTKRFILLQIIVSFACSTFAANSFNENNSNTDKFLYQETKEVSENNRTAILIHYWLFDTSIPNDIPLENLDAFYSILNGGTIIYHSALAGYPFDPDHPDWRKAAMERRNAPTPINYRPEGNSSIPYEDLDMRGLQIKQPFTGDGGENTMVFHLPTTDFDDVIFRFAAKDEDAADNLVIDYSVVQGTPEWITTGLSNSTPALSSEYQLFEFDFSNISSSDDNPDFKVRIRFAGSNMSADEGNRVTFNNFSLDGNSIGGMNLPPVVEEILPLQEIIEAGESQMIDLNDIFSDPDNDLLTFTAQSNRPEMAETSLADNLLTITPLRRGDAEITLTASDGNYPPVGTEFRVLVHPEAFQLSSGQFSFNAWDPDVQEYIYPPHVLFMQSDMNDPGLNDPLLFPYYIPHTDYHQDDIATIGFPYNNTRRTRINGLGEDGISFINTGRDRDLGGMVLALDTRNVTDATLDWLGGTVLQNERTYAIRLQYRTAPDQLFMDLTNNNQIVEYMTGNDNDVELFENIHLPAEALGKAYVQLLWKYYHVEGDSGPRAELRLDNILFNDLTSVTDAQEIEVQVNFDGHSVQLQLSEPIIGELSVYDVTGRLMTRNKIVYNDHSTFGLNAKPGVYILHIITDETSWSKKFFVR